MKPSSLIGRLAVVAAALTLSSPAGQAWAAPTTPSPALAVATASAQPTDVPSTPVAPEASGAIGDEGPEGTAADGVTGLPTAPVLPDPTPETADGGSTSGADPQDDAAPTAVDPQAGTQAMPTTSAPAPHAARSDHLVCWGDSLTNYLCNPAWQTNGVSYMQEAVGQSRVVDNHGIGSQNSTDIALRMGVGELTVTFPDNTIPASGSVSVDVVAPTGLSRIFASEVTIAGVEGFLTRTQTVVGRWTFQRSGSGDATHVDGAQPVTIMDSLDRNDPGFIWAGRNNPDDADAIIRDVASMWSLHSVGSTAPMWVIGLTPATGEGVGTSRYAVREHVNTVLQQTYGSRYIPMDEYLRNSALGELGMSPTAQDRIDMSQGLIPRTLLMPDGLHLNEIGRRAAAGYIAAFITSQDTTYLTSFDPQADLSVASQSDGVATLVGWGFDKSDIGRSLMATITVDGRAVNNVSASLPSDYLSAYGVWGRHALAVGVDLEDGRHTVCAEFENLYAGSDRVVCVSVTAGSGSAGGPRTLGGAGSPQGDVVVSAPQDYGHAVVMGWAFDHSELTTSIDVAIYVDGNLASSVGAGLASDYLYPYGVPGRHAFLAAVAASDGPHTVCVTAINRGPGRDRHLGCTRVTVTSAPTDPGGDASATLSSDNVLSISGYTYDPSNLSASTDILVFQGSTLTTRRTANLGTPSLRPYGIPGNHGFSVDVPLIGGGSRDVCVLALNIGEGANTWLKCWSASDQTLSPVAAVSAERDTDGGLLISGWAIDFSLQEQPLSVAITVDGRAVTTTTAGRPRQELAWLYNWRGDHGFEVHAGASANQSHEVCATASGIGRGGSTRTCVTYQP